MPFDKPDSQDSNHIHSGDPRIWGVLSDLVIVKETQSFTVPDDQMKYTPDGLPEKVVPPPGSETEEEPIEDDPPAEPPPEPSPLTDGIRIVERAPRASLNLDKGWVVQSYLDPARPRKYSRATDYNARTGKADDSGMNPVKMGAVGKLTDIFRVSVADNVTKGSALTPTPPAGEALPYDLHYSYNDMFGTGAPGSPDIRFGRLEIRITAHFYQGDRRSGPLTFLPVQWPRDEAETVIFDPDADPDAEPESEFSTHLPGGIPRICELDYRFVESAVAKAFPEDLGGVDPDLVELVDAEPGEGLDLFTEGLRGEVLCGALLFDPRFHAWGVVVSIKRRPNCIVTNFDIAAETKVDVDGTLIDPGEEFDELIEAETLTLDDRVFFFSGLPAPDTGVPALPKCAIIEPPTKKWDCSALGSASYIECAELGGLSLQDRWVMLADRHNALLNEIDRIYCIIKTLDVNIGLLVEFADAIDTAVDVSATYAAFKAEMAEIDEVFLATTTCKEPPA
jgi:hypothetical protein